MKNEINKILKSYILHDDTRPFFISICKGQRQGEQRRGKIITMASLARHADVIVNMIDDHMTNENISAHLSQMGVQKCSARSVRRFCKEHNVKRRSHFDDSHLELVVASAIN